MAFNGSDVPILFIHEGDSWYLPYALYQAQHASRGSRVVLLGGRSYEGITNVPLEGLGVVEAEAFRKKYIHMSTNPEAFELFCFLRWYYLLQYMKLNEIGAVFYFDSDVLLFSSTDEMLEAFGPADLTCAFLVRKLFESHGLAGASSAHMSYWTRHALEEFCDFMGGCYGQDKYLEVLKKTWDGHFKAGNPGGICDMTVLHLFWKEHPDGVKNFAKSRPAGVFDNNINCGANYEEDEYVMQGGMKKIEFDGKTPMLVKADGRQTSVRAHALHFQAGAKGSMPLYYTGKNFENKMAADLKGLAYRLRGNFRKHRA